MRLTREKVRPKEQKVRSLKLLLEIKGLAYINLLRHQAKVRPDKDATPHVRLKISNPLLVSFQIS